MEKTNKKQKRPPRNIRYGLISPKTKELIKQLSGKYKLNSSSKQEEVVKGLLGDFLNGKLNEINLKKEVFRLFQFDALMQEEFLKNFKQASNEIKKNGIESVKEDLVAMRIKDLIKRFPEIKKQEIGIHPIVFPGENQEREPFIENWIADFKLRKNDEQETTILNVSDYLYNSENARQLNEKERSKLSVVLNNYENNKNTYYNTLFNQIDFEIIELLSRSQKSKTDFNITKLESRPFHDTDLIKQKKKQKDQVNFKSKPITKISAQEMKNNNKPQPTNVLDLNKYI